MTKLLIQRLGLTLCLAFIFGCAPAPETSSPSTIKIQMPSSDRSKRSASNNLRGLQNVGSSLFQGSTLSIIDDVDCYTVAVAHKGYGSCSGEETFGNI